MAAVSHEPKGVPHVAHVEAGPQSDYNIPSLKGEFDGHAATDEYVTTSFP